MPLYEFFCKSCQIKFEQICSSQISKAPCPKCQKFSKEKLISRFSVGGRGDLRESTLHGCHEDWKPGTEGSSHLGEDPHTHSDHDHCHGHSHSHGGLDADHPLNPNRLKKSGTDD